MTTILSFYYFVILVNLLYKKRKHKTIYGMYVTKTSPHRLNSRQTSTWSKWRMHAVGTYAHELIIVLVLQAFMLFFFLSLYRYNLREIG